MTKAKAESGPEIPTFDPQQMLSQAQQFAAPWTTAASEQLERWQAATQQWASWQDEGMQRMVKATDELGELVKRGMKYSAELAEQARVASVETARRYVDLVTPRA
jgi:hypothetical protein